MKVNNTTAMRRQKTTGSLVKQVNTNPMNTTSLKGSEDMTQLFLKDTFRQGGSKECLVVLEEDKNL